MTPLLSRRSLLRATPFVALLSALPMPHLQAQPQVTAAIATAHALDETWTDASRQRDIPVKLRWPDEKLYPGERHVLLFSHGLGGTREGGAVWGEAWAAAGFVVLHVQHPGSDLPALRAVTTSFTDRNALRSVASPEQLMARWRDIQFILDEIQRRHAARQYRWGTVQPARIGLSGHSFGAHTTLGMAGQRYPAAAGGSPIVEPRLASFIGFSPTAPPAGDAQAAFSGLVRPLLSVTGTRDSDVAGVGATPERRFAVFGALPPGYKAHLVLQDADHMTFGGQTGRAAEVVRREAVTRELQPRHHALIAAITTDWWRSTLLADASASERLIQPAGLANGDLWQRK